MILYEILYKYNNFISLKTMNNLGVSLENCFGIGKLDHNFDFTKSKISLIYAPNGTMKTSFAKTFHLVSKNNPKELPSDRVYISRKTKCEIFADSDQINPNNIIVINSEDADFDATNKISTFLASKDLKKEYDEIYKELNSQKVEFIRRLKTISQSSDCEKEVMNTFSNISNLSFFEIIFSLKDRLEENYKKVEFKYNDVFDAKGNVEKFLTKNQSILDQYINSYKNIISKSNFFKESTNSTFGTYQANEILKSIEDNSFFNAGHTFVLEDQTVVRDSEKLKELVQDEIKNILSDEKLKESFVKVDKAITSNTELRAFHKVIEKNNLILLNLKNYQGFKKEVWISYISEIKLEAEILVELYEKKKQELERIIEQSKKESLLWIKIVQTFNSRFFVPFKVILGNQDDIILKQETASLHFEYSDRNEEPVKQDKKSLLGVLSKGEQRAYFILQFLFELESRKLNDEVNLLILDDISESFDYKNKFAIIEYIKDINDLDNFRTIILTHNFDFYRTVSSRFNLDKSVVYMALRNEDKEVNLKTGNDLRDVFPSLIKNFADPKSFISLIAFVRNLVQYSESKKNENYISLTNCLHLKEDSLSLTSNDIFNIYAKKLFFLEGKSIEFGSENIIELIYKTSDAICKEPIIDEILLENKIVLAIAIRLKSEHYTISKLKEFDLDLDNQWNQTRYLYDKYKKHYPDCNSLIILDKVNLMTPENIHINAFMYEPLIDMSVNHLTDLYKDISNLSSPLSINS